MKDRSLPRHIALILDGNGRWASQRGLPRTQGHEHGANAVRTAVRGAHERNIEFLTLYAFSVNNWNRPKEEVDALMRICTEFAEGEREDLVRRGVKVTIVGEIDEASLRSFLTTSALPDPDLIIRTGGERRLSDFLLFESAYAELFFTETYWPDFTEATLDEALDAYARRQRRYGRTGAQVSNG